MNNPMILISAMVTAYLCVVQGQARCGDLCVPYTQCPHLSDLITSTHRTPQQTDLLRKSFCGYHDYDTPKVCCTNPPTTAPPPVLVSTNGVADRQCFSPNGLAGECVGLNSCARIKAMLSNKPVPRENLEFAKNSKCVGPEAYSVCCESEEPIEDPCRRPTATPPSRASECCGISSSNPDRITGGNRTEIDQYPWLALIEYKGKDEKIQLLCGGALISGKYVLTAGHCVTGPVMATTPPVNIRLGEFDTSNEGWDCLIVSGGGKDCTRGTTTIPIESIIVYPEYDANSVLRRHDIALIRMRWLAPYTDFIRPICLPSIDVKSVPNEELRFWVAGWGQVDKHTLASNLKLHVEVPYRSLEKCQPSYSVPRRSVPLTKGHLCAGGEKGKDSCKGDSGGPLMYEYNKLFELVGVVSFGPSPCGLENVPGVYTYVYEYNSWILNQIKP